MEARKHSAHTEPRVRVSPLRNPRADIWIKEAASDRTERRFTERGGGGCRAAPEAGSVFDRPLEKCYLICSHDGPRWGLHHAVSLPSFSFQFPSCQLPAGWKKKSHRVVVGLLRVIFSVLSKRYDLERQGSRSP